VGGEPAAEEVAATTAAAAAEALSPPVWAPGLVAVGRRWMRPGSCTRKVTALATAR
jgi:hypothetical protein